MKDAALKYAAAGKPVFPCGGDKKPLTEHGFKDASADPDQVERWWTEHPDAMIGFPTGPATGTVVIDLDLDPEKGIDGTAAIQAITEKNGALPPTRVAGTPRGGRHLYFKLPEGITIRSSKATLGPGIDVRAAGGYVIAPPSKAPRGEYRWTCREPMAPLPDWLCERLKDKPKPPRPDPGPSTPDLSARQRIAAELLGAIEWESETRGFCECPGAARHTNPPGKRDCRVDLDSAPTVHCVHTSCRTVVDAMNHSLRSRIGKEERADTGTAKYNGYTAPAGRDSLTEKYGSPLDFGKTGPAGINERYFAALFASEKEVVFDPAEARFYLYNPANGVWERTTEAAMSGHMHSRFLRWLREEDEPGAFKFHNVRAMARVVTALREIAGRDHPFDTRLLAIHAANGMLVLDPDQAVPRLEPFSPRFMSRAQSPLAFEFGAWCPRMEKELLDPVLKKVDQVLLRKFAGLALIGRNLAQRIALLHGEGNLGKGTFVRLLKMVIGRDNVRELRTEMLHERFEIGRYAGGSLLLGQDVAADFLMHRGASALKKLTGGDDVDGEGKGSNERMRLAGTFNVIITSNSRLRAHLEGDHSAWRRRLALIEFDGKPPEKRIIDFEEVLFREEGPGILNWCATGFLEAIRDIRETGDLRLIDEQKQRVETLLMESDSIRLFVGAGIEKAEGGTVTVEEAVKAYFDFCRERGFATFTVRQVENELKTLMLDIHGTVRRHDLERFKKKVRGWRNVRLRNEEAESVPDGSDDQIRIPVH